MRETHVGSEFKAVAKDVLHLGARYVQAGRAWLSDRRDEMAHRNEASDREQSTYGLSGSLRERQQSGGQHQPWRESSGPQQRNQGSGQSQQYEGGPQQYESGQHRSQEMGQGHNQGSGSSERLQGWENERGSDFQTSGQDYGQGSQGYEYGQGGQNRGQGYGQQTYGQGMRAIQGQSVQRGLQGQGSQYGQFGYGEGREGFGQDRALGNQMGYGSSIHSDQDIPGKRGFRGVGPKNYSRPDDRIRDDVCERLTQDDDLDASNIEIKVEQGKVTLEGTVDERWMKHRAEDVAESCSGVRDVDNRIRVESGSSQRTSDTESLGKTGNESLGTQTGGTSGKH